MIAVVKRFFRALFIFSYIRFVRGRYSQWKPAESSLNNRLISIDKSTGSNFVFSGSHS